MKTKSTPIHRQLTAASAESGSTFVNGAPRPATTANLRSRTLTAFNPALPLDGSLIVADVLRDQFNALNEDTQTRVTQPAFDAEVAQMNGEINARMTLAQVDVQIYSAIQSTARNPLNVQPLYVAISEPPTAYEVQAILDRLNELITGVYRAP